MRAILLGYIVVSLCGLAVRPFMRRALHALPDGGHAAGRCFGLIVSTWIAYMLVLVRGVPLGTGAAILSLFLAALIGHLPLVWNLLRRRPSSPTIGPLIGPTMGPTMVPTIGKPGSPGIGQVLRRVAPQIWTEALFLGGVIAFSWILAHNPAVDPDSERFMDYALLQSHLRTTDLPVADPWLSGRPINYYGFGYAMAAFIVRATGSDASSSFIAILALIHALLLVMSFGLGLAVTGKCRGGLVAAGLVVVAGNLEWMVQLFRGGTLGALDWFSSSRAVEGGITEFPWFSLLWGDLHPYVFGLPVFACALLFSMAAVLHRSGAEAGTPGSKATISMCGVGFAVAVGALLATHPWDVPVLMLATVTMVFLAPAGWGATRTAVASSALAPSAMALSMLIPGALLFLPFMRGFAQQGRRFGIVTSWSAPHELAIAFGPFLLLAIPGFLFLRGPIFRFRKPHPWRHSDGRGRIAVALAVAAILTIAICEIVYVRDIFDGTPLFRMNTVFKLHRLSWFLLGIVSPLLVERMVRSGRKIPVIAWLAVVGLLSAVYPLAGTVSWIGSATEAVGGSEPALAAAQRPGAGAADLFRAQFPGDAAVVEYLRANAGAGDVVLEEAGDAYTWSSRIASFSGVPTVLGWANHEAGWRGGWERVLERSRDIESIYRDPDGDRARALLQEYHVTWVVVGERERRRYGTEGPSRFHLTGRMVMEHAGTRLYRVGS